MSKWIFYETKLKSVDSQCGTSREQITGLLGLRKPEWINNLVVHVTKSSHHKTQCNSQYTLLLYDLQREGGFAMRVFFFIIGVHMRKETKRMCQKMTAIDVAGRTWCHVELCKVSRFTCCLKWLVCVSQGGRQDRRTIGEQLVSCDHHKLLCLHLTLDGHAVLLRTTG